MNIAYDIDGVLANFQAHFLRTAEDMGLESAPEHWTLCTDWGMMAPDEASQIWDRIGDDIDWWMQIEPHEDAHIVTPVHCYITSRSIPSEKSSAWLNYHGFPTAPVFTVGVGNSKLQAAREAQVDVLIDDKPKTVRELNRNGVDCLLRDRPVNRSERDLDPVRLHCLTQVPRFLP